MPPLEFSVKSVEVEHRDPRGDDPWKRTDDCGN